VEAIFSTRLLREGKLTRRERERERERTLQRRSGRFGYVGHIKRVFFVEPNGAASRRFLHVHKGCGGGEVSRMN